MGQQFPAAKVLVSTWYRLLAILALIAILSIRSPSCTLVDTNTRIVRLHSRSSWTRSVLRRRSCDPLDISSLPSLRYSRSRSTWCGAPSISTWHRPQISSDWLSLRQVPNFQLSQRKCNSIQAALQRNDASDDVFAKQRIALLIDGDAQGMAACRLCVRYIRERSTLLLGRIYVSSQQALTWKSELDELGVRPIVVQRPHGGSKDPTDIMLAMDAVQLATRSDSSDPQVSAIVIVATDSDYALVHVRILELGLLSYHMMPVVTQVIPVMPKVLSSSCTAVIFAKEESGRVENVEPRAPTDTENEAIERLAALGYVTPQITEGDGNCPVDGHFNVRQAVATFVHVHDLEAFKQNHFPYYNLPTVLPALLIELSKVPLSSWRVKPLGLRCYEGVSNHKPPLSKTSVRSWPFKYVFLHASDALVIDVLLGLGYLDTEMNADIREAVSLLVRTNSVGSSTSHIAMRALLANGADHPEMVSCLDTVFRSNSIIQIWRLPRIDCLVRDILFGRGFVTDANAAASVSMKAMANFLREANVEPAATYNFRVWQCLEVMVVKRDPRPPRVQGRS